jgi:hypothetical protein
MCDRAFAQIIPNVTLVAESSVVTPFDAIRLPIDKIDGDGVTKK